MGVWQGPCRGKLRARGQEGSGAMHTQCGVDAIPRRACPQHNSPVGVAPLEVSVKNEIRTPEKRPLGRGQQLAHLRGRAPQDEPSAGPGASPAHAPVVQTLRNKTLKRIAPHAAPAPHVGAAPTLGRVPTHMSSSRFHLGLSTLSPVYLLGGSVRVVSVVARVLPQGADDSCQASREKPKRICACTHPRLTWLQRRASPTAGLLPASCGGR